MLLQYSTGGLAGAASPAMIPAAALLADCHALAMGAGRDPAQEARSDGDQITPAIVALRKLLNFHLKKKNYLTSIDTCLRKRMVLASLVLGT